MAAGLLAFTVVANSIRTIVPLSLNVDWKFEKGETLEPFWTGTGFSPTPSSSSISDFLLSKDQEMNLALIGSVPNKGITHVRTHWLLDLINATCKDNKPWEFGFENLDTFLTMLHENELSPGFELMGNPSGCFQDWTQQTGEWIRFIQLLLKRYIDKFGIQYIRTWRIETLNEPDLKMYNRWNMTLANYLLYVEASAKTLEFFNLNLWGPAGLFKSSDNHPLCWGLLDHCNTNSCPIKVLTFHKKGDGVASLVVRRGEEFISQVKEKFPNLRNISMANDEADPLTGWIKPVKWRGDTRYAAAVVQIALGYLNSSRENSFKMTAISNDNGFLSYWPHFWSQRTLFARFQMNNTNPPHVQMFRKPVHSALALMSMLGSKLISTKYDYGNPGVSFLSTGEKSRRAMVLIVNNDTLCDEEWKQQFFELSLHFQLPINNAKGRGAIYILDNQVTNPQKVWEEAGRPNFPNRQLRRAMRFSEEPEVTHFTIEENQTDLFVHKNLSVPSVLFINLCYNDDDTHGVARRLRYIEITRNEILLLWNDTPKTSKCLKMYVIEFRPIRRKKFRRIGERIQTNSFHFDGCLMRKRGPCQEINNISGHYRVAAVDLWDQTGPYSNMVFVAKNNKELNQPLLKQFTTTEKDKTEEKTPDADQKIDAAGEMKRKEEKNATVPGSSSVKELSADLASGSTEKDDDSAVEMIRKYMAEKLGFLDKKSDSSKKKVLDEVTVDAVVRYIKSGNCQNILVMAGAGISTSAGIPDFRSPGSGLYDNLAKYKLPHPQAIFEIDFFKENPEPFFTLAKNLFPGSYRPTPAHYFVRLLHEKGLLLRHYTQNIDGLEKVAGVPPDKVVEAHGTFYTSHCLSCRKEFCLDWIKDKIFEEKVPKCDECEGLVKPDIVFFGEALPERFFRLVEADFPKASLLIIMGSSLVVHPFASLVDRVKSHVPRLLINREKAGQRDRIMSLLGMGGGLDLDSDKNVRDVAFLGDCDDLVRQLVDKLNWNEEFEALQAEDS